MEIRMKLKNKSVGGKCLVFGANRAVVGMLLILGVTVNSGVAQSYKSYNSRPSSSYRNHVWSDPYKQQYQYQFVPALPASGGPGLIGGGRIVEAVKAHPLHYSSSSPPYYPGPGPFSTTSASHSSPSYYSGYYYDKMPATRYPGYSVSSTMYSPPPSPYYHQSSNPSPVTTVVSSSPVSYGRPPAPPPPPPPSYHLTPSRYPTGPVSSSSMDTYREALDLFSEVVQKLEKETGGGFSMYKPPNYLQSSLLANSIPGSTPGLPHHHHLDHIMGPDFIQRAQKLYNKIIKEQKYNRPSSPPPAYHPLSSQPFSSSSHRYNSYSHTSPYSRNMVLDKLTPDSALERSLIDTVRSLEFNLAKYKNQPVEPDTSSSAIDEMETSESRMVPHAQYPPSEFQNPTMPPSFPPPSPSSPPTTAAPVTSTEVATISKAIPLPQNDFIEHPLPYNEYAKLIRDIAVNHNY